MYFDSIQPHSLLNSSKISYTHLPTLCLLSFFNNPRSANFVCMYVFLSGVIHWRVVDLPGGIPLKKNDSLSPKSH